RLYDFTISLIADNGSGAPGQVVNQRSYTQIAPRNSAASVNFSTKLVKVGTGVLTLAGNNTYVGSTEIQEGELRIANAAGSASGSGPLTIGPSSGATTAVLSGPGRVSGTVTFGPGSTV